MSKGDRSTDLYENRKQGANVMLGSIHSMYPDWVMKQAKKLPNYFYR